MDLWMTTMAGLGERFLSRMIGRQRSKRKRRGLDVVTVWRRMLWETISSAGWWRFWWMVLSRREGRQRWLANEEGMGERCCQKRKEEGRPQWLTTIDLYRYRRAERERLHKYNIVQVMNESTETVEHLKVVRYQGLSGCNSHRSKYVFRSTVGGRRTIFGELLCQERRMTNDGRRTNEEGFGERCCREGGRKTTIAGREETTMFYDGRWRRALVSFFVRHCFNTALGDERR